MTVAPSVIARHVRVIALSLAEGKIFYFFKMHNVTLRNSGAGGVHGVGGVC
jgi:hypothetical protein